MENLELVFGLIWLTGCALHFVGTQVASTHLTSHPPHLDAPFRLFPVSILKPLKGVDSGLVENLRSFFELKYPEFELLFSVSSSQDPALQVVKKLMEEYPKIKARVIEGEVVKGPNPKVNNLYKSYAEAKYDLILISDSNVRVAKDYLTQIVAHLESGVGVVTSLVRGDGANSIGGQLESMMLNTYYVRGMFLADLFNRPCVLGKSMLFNRKTAARFGGIETLSRYLAEDYMAGVAFQKLGLRVITMSRPIVQFIGDYTFNQFWSRHIRWGRIRKSQSPLTFLIEPFFGCFGAGLLGSLFLSNFYMIHPLVCFLGHLIVWGLVDSILLYRMGVNFSFSRVAQWLIRESLSFPMWLHIASGKTVNWRGKKLALQAGGLLDLEFLEKST